MQKSILSIQPKKSAAFQQVKIQKGPGQESSSSSQLEQNLRLSR